MLSVSSVAEEHSAGLDFLNKNFGYLPQNQLLPLTINTFLLLYSKFLVQALLGHTKMKIMQRGQNWQITQNLLAAYPTIILAAVMYALLQQRDKLWGTFFTDTGSRDLIYALPLNNKPYILLTSEYDCSGWPDNGVAITGADVENATATQITIKTRWIFPGQVTINNSSLNYLMIGR